MAKNQGPCIVCGLLTKQELTFDRQSVRVCPVCEKNQGVRCPVQCGRCCAELWDRVVSPRGTARPLSFPRPPDDRMPAGQCPHQRARGCRLARPAMPYSCRLWVCELGLRVLWGALSRREARRVVKAGAQWEPDRWSSVLKGR